MALSPEEFSSERVNAMVQEMRNNGFDNLSIFEEILHMAPNQQKNAVGEIHINTDYTNIVLQAVYGIEIQ